MYGKKKVYFKNITYLYLLILLCDKKNLSNFTYYVKFPNPYRNVDFVKKRPASCLSVFYICIVF